MVKRREPNTGGTKREISRFVEQADSTSHDPKAPRNFKSIAIPFNEYEFNRLEYACDKTGRSKNSLIRFLILQCAQKIENGEQMV